MRIFYLLSTLLTTVMLSACVSAVPVGTPSAEQLQQLSNLNATQSANSATQSVIIAFDSTQQYAQAAAQASQVAVFTQQEQDRRYRITEQFAATQAVLDMTPAAATAVMLQATTDAISARSTQDAHYAITEVALTARALDSTQQSVDLLYAEQQRREHNATQAQALGTFLPVCFGLVILFSVAIAMALSAHAVTIYLERLRLNSYYRVTPIGDFLILPNRNDDSIRVVPVNVPQLSAPVIDNETDADSDEAESSQYTRHTDGKRVTYWERSPLQAPDDKNRLLRRDVLKLLSESIAVSGNDATSIPRFDKLPSWRTRPRDWTRLTNYLVDNQHAVKVIGAPPAGGTHLRDGLTLYALLTLLTER